MDIKYFSLSRIEFISRFYEKALSPFVEMKFLIEEEKPPFEPEYSECDEPQFLSEWLDSEQAIDVLGVQCMSLLSSTLKLFLKESLENVFKTNIPKITKKIKTESAYKTEFKKGWLNGYRHLFANEFSLDWQASGINLLLIEELILIRNRSQHPEHITMMSDRFSEKDLVKVPSPYFVDNVNDNEDLIDFFAPMIKPHPDKMRLAFEESLKLINWLETSLEKWAHNQTT